MEKKKEQERRCSDGRRNVPTRGTAGTAGQFKIFEKVKG